MVRENWEAEAAAKEEHARLVGGIAELERELGIEPEGLAGV
jgi:hypothetical protein